MTSWSSGDNSKQLCILNMCCCNFYHPQIIIILWNLEYVLSSTAFTIIYFIKHTIVFMSTSPLSWCKYFYVQILHLCYILFSLVKVWYLLCCSLLKVVKTLESIIFSLNGSYIRMWNSFGKICKLWILFYL